MNKNKIINKAKENLVYNQVLVINHYSKKDQKKELFKTFYKKCSYGENITKDLLIKMESSNK